MLPMTKPEMEAALNAAPGFFAGVLPGGTYKGQEKPVNTLVGGNTFIVDKDMPEKVVYNLVKAAFQDGGARFKQTVPQYKDIDLIKTAVDRLIVPLHPGAEKYWRERGLKISKPLVETKPLR